jgi:hypothetical protein
MQEPVTASTSMSCVAKPADMNKVRMVQTYGCDGAQGTTGCPRPAFARIPSQGVLDTSVLPTTTFYPTAIAALRRSQQIATAHLSSGHRTGQVMSLAAAI